MNTVGELASVIVLALAISYILTDWIAYRSRLREANERHERIMAEIRGRKPIESGDEQ